MGEPIEGYDPAKSEVENLTRAVWALVRELRSAFTIEPPQPGEEFPTRGRPKGPTASTPRAERDAETAAIQAAAHAALASPAAAVSVLAVVRELRTARPGLGKQRVGRVLLGMGLTKIRQRGSGGNRPSLWVRR